MKYISTKELRVCDNCGRPESEHKENNCPFIDLKIDPLTAMCILGNIQLATRHPANNGPSRDVAVKFARELQQRIEYWMPNQAAICEMGWDPNFDMD